jgi:hypothetical protein
MSYLSIIQGLNKKNGRMLNVNNSRGLVRYKAVKVATLNSITQIVFFTHQRVPT